jgi:hypothetical protein
MGIMLRNILTGIEKPCEPTETGNIEKIISITRDRSVSHPTQGGKLHITEREGVEEELMKH